MSRRVAPESRADELLEAGLAVLRDKGTAATVADVTDRAGTAKGNFYRYFDSWDAFLAAVRDRTVEAWFAESEVGAVGDAAGFWRLAEEELARFVAYHEHLGPAHEALFHGRSDPDGPDATGVTTALLALGQGVGAVRADLDLEATADFVFAALHAASDRVVAGADRDRTLQALLDLLRGGLA